jgi:hypothetical protein
MQAPYMAFSVDKTPIYLVKAPVDEKYNNIDINLPDHIIVILKPMKAAGSISINAKSIIVLSVLESPTQIHLIADKIVIAMLRSLNAPQLDLPSFVAWFFDDISVDLAQIDKGILGRNPAKIWSPVNQLVRQITRLTDGDDAMSVLGIERLPSPLLCD